MASFALTDATVWVGGIDATTDHNQIGLDVTANELDVTTFGNDGYMKRIGGLQTVEFNHQGFSSYAQPDQQLFADLGAAGRVITISPTGDDGDTAYTFESLRTTYTPLQGSVADAAQFVGTAMNSGGRDGLVRATILYPKQSVSSTGAGTARQLGAVASDEFLYVSYHCFTAGTTVTIQVRSDDNSGMTSPTVQADETITATGAVWETRVAGPITDDWWDVNISAITGTFSLAVVAGIK